MLQEVLRDNSLTKGTMTNCARSCKKYVLYLSVYLSRKYFLRTLFLLAPTADRNIILLQWSSTPGEGLAVCRTKTVPLFLRFFKTLSIGEEYPVPSKQSFIRWRRPWKRNLPPYWISVDVCEHNKISRMKKSKNSTSHTVKFVGSGWRLWAHHLLLIINLSEKVIHNGFERKSRASV